MKQKVIFLLSHQPNPRFIKQINYISKSKEVHVFHFSRNGLKELPMQSYYKNVKVEELAIIQNFSFKTLYNRLFQYLVSVKRLRHIFKKNNFDFIIMNNIDMYFLYRLSSFALRKQLKKVIEISDLIYLHEKNNFFAKLFKFFEKIAFSKIDKVIFTSEKFYSNYYYKIYDRKYFILENKPLSNMLPKKIKKRKNKKVIIGIVGLLLQLETYKYLFDYIKNNKNFEVHIYGKGVYETEVKKYAEQNDNIKFFGSYNFFQDISKIYSSIDIIYMAYSSKIQSLNNKLALPNKLYEAMYFKVPIITSKNTYLGELVENFSIGHAIDYSNNNELRIALESILFKKEFFLKNFESLNEEIYLGDQDYKKFLIFLDE